MKITNLETFVVDGGWRAWTYVKVETDAGLTGWGECSDYRVTNAVEGMVRDHLRISIGKPEDNDRVLAAIREIGEELAHV